MWFTTSDFTKPIRWQLITVSLSSQILELKIKVYFLHLLIVELSQIEAGIHSSSLLETL